MSRAALYLFAWLLGAFPAQSREVSRMALERHSDACTNLTPAQCCAQMLEIAVFRATGDQVPRAAKTPVRLSCEDPGRTFPETSCRLIALARGFSARDAADICAPGGLAKRCSDDATCRQCVSDLDKMEWKASSRACYALTYVSKPGNDSRMVTLRTGGRDANGGVAVRVRRTVVR